eukprot:320845-Rhodomonas_salina.4
MPLAEQSLKTTETRRKKGRKKKKEEACFASVLVRLWRRNGGNRRAPRRSDTTQTGARGQSDGPTKASTPTHPQAQRLNAVQQDKHSQHDECTSTKPISVTGRCKTWGVEDTRHRIEER